MQGKERREDILRRLIETDKPLNGTDLAKIFDISRQVIVQDIAILRAENHPIISTNRGYIFGQQESRPHRTFCVKHTREETIDELNVIVDEGGHVLNTTVEHDLYGQITVEMFLKNRRDVKEFMKQLDETKSVLLTSLTDGLHFHTVTAETEEDLDRIEESLKERGFYVDLIEE